MELYRTLPWLIMASESVLCLGVTSGGKSGADLITINGN